MYETSIKRSVWDWVFYASLGILTVWLIFKVTGVIQTPLIIEYGIPIASLILILFSFFEKFVEWFTTLSKEVGAVKVDVEHVKGDVGRVKGEVEHMEKRVERVEKDIVAVKADVEKTRVDIGVLKKWLSKS